MEKARSAEQAFDPHRQLPIQLLDLECILVRADRLAGHVVLDYHLQIVDPGLEGLERDQPCQGDLLAVDGAEPILPILLDAKNLFVLLGDHVLDIDARSKSRLIDGHIVDLHVDPSGRSCLNSPVAFGITFSAPRTN